MIFSMFPPVALADDVNFTKYNATISVDGVESTIEQINPGVISAAATQTRPNGAVYQKAVVRKGTGSSIRDVEITSAAVFEGSTYYAFESDPDTGIKLKTEEGERIVLIYNTKYTVTYDIQNLFSGTERRVSTRGCPTELWKGEDLNLSIIPDKYYVVASTVADIDGHGEVPITLDYLGKGTVPANIINGNVTVRIEVAKPSAFTVKELAKGTPENGIQHGDFCAQCSANSASTYLVAPGATAKFYIYSQAWTGGEQWYLNRFEINGEDVLVPRSFDPTKLNATQTTTLANGSVVTVKLLSTYDRDDHVDNRRRCKYEVTVTDVQNDLVLTGSFKEGGRREVALKGLAGISKSGMAREDTRYVMFQGWYYDYSLQETQDNVYQAYYRDGDSGAPSYNIFVYDVLPGYNPWTISYGGYGVGALQRGPELIEETVNAMNTNFRNFWAFQTQAAEQDYKYSFAIRENESRNQHLILNAVPYEFAMRFNLNSGTLEEEVYEEDYYLDKSTQNIVDKDTYQAINGGQYAYTPGFTPARKDYIFTGWKLVGDTDPNRVFGSSETFLVDTAAMEMALANSTNSKANSQGFTFTAQWTLEHNNLTYANYEVVYFIEAPSNGTISYNGTRYDVYMTQTKVGKVGDTVIAYGTNNPNPMQYELNTSISKMVVHDLQPFSNEIHAEHNRLSLFYDLRDDYLNIDVDGDGIPDLNIDVDGDGIPDFNIVTKYPDRPSLNIAPGYEEAYDKKTGKWDTGRIKATINIDKDGDGKPDINIDIDGDGIPDMNVDVNDDGQLTVPPDEYVDTDGDGVPDAGISDRTKGLMFHNVTITLDGEGTTLHNLFSGPVRDVAPETWGGNLNMGLYKAVVRTGDDISTDFEIEYTACYDGVSYYSVSADNVGLTKLQPNQKIVLMYKTGYAVTYQPRVNGLTGGGDFGKGPKMVFAGEDLLFNVYPDQYHRIESVQVKMGNLTQNPVQNADGSYELPASEINADITVTASFVKVTEYLITSHNDHMIYGDLCTCDQSDKTVEPGGTARFEVSSFDWDVGVAGFGDASYYLLRFDINGENIEVPKSFEVNEMESRATTTLKNGSVATVTLIKAGEKDPCNRDKSYGFTDTEYRRIYEITVTDVKEDIHISGEFRSLGDAKISFSQLDGFTEFGASAEKYEQGIRNFVFGTHYDYWLQQHSEKNTYNAYNSSRFIANVQSRGFFFYSVKPGFNPWSLTIDEDKSVGAGALDGPQLAETLVGVVDSSAYHHVAGDIKNAVNNGTYTHAFELGRSGNDHQIIYLQADPYQYTLRFKLGTGTINDDDLEAADYRRSIDNTYVFMKNDPHYTLKDGAVKIPVLPAIPSSAEGGFRGWKLEADNSPDPKVYKPGGIFTLDESTVAYAQENDLQINTDHPIVFVPVFDLPISIVEYGTYEIRSYVQDVQGTVLIKVADNKYNAYSLAKEPTLGTDQAYRAIVATDRVNPNAAKYVFNEAISKTVIDYVDPLPPNPHYGLLPESHPLAKEENVLIYYYDWRYSINLNEHTDGDGVPDFNIDIDGDGKPDINIDSDGDGIPDVNLLPNYVPHYNKDTQVWDSATVPALNIDTNGTGIWSPSKDNRDDDGIWNPDRKIDVDGNGSADDAGDIAVNPLKVFDFDGDGVDDNWANAIGDDRSVSGTSGSFEYETGDPSINADADGDGIPDVNVDTDGDGKPDINIDTDGDGKPDINIDTDGNNKPDLNIDVDGDGKPDINVDTNGDGFSDINIIPHVESKFTDTSGNDAIDRSEIPSNLTPEINIDTDGTGTWKPSGNGGNSDNIWLPDKNVDIDGDGVADIGTDSRPWSREPIDEDGNGIDDKWDEVSGDYPGIDANGDGKPDYATGDPRIDYGIVPERPDQGTPPGSDNPYKDVDGETVIILRGDWANESTFKPTVKDNSGATVNCDWSVVSDSWTKHSFNSAAVSITADGTITVLRSGITEIRGMYKGSEIVFTVIVPGDYNRSNSISGTDASTVLQVNAEAIDLDSRLYALELADMNRSNTISGADGSTIRSVNAEEIFIVNF